MNNPNHFPSLSFDGCGINGRDEYRSRIATFADRGGPIAKEYGPLFAAAPELLEDLKGIVAYASLCKGTDIERVKYLAQLGIDRIEKSR
jgi:hypothetical protein